MKYSLVFVSALSVTLATPLSPIPPPVGTEGGQDGAQCNENELKCAQNFECTYADGVQPGAGVNGQCKPITYGKEGDHCGAYNPENPEPLCGSYLTCKLDDPTITDKGGKCVPVPASAEDGMCGFQNDPETRPIAEIPCNAGLECAVNPLPQKPDEHYGVCKPEAPKEGAEGGKCRPTDGSDYPAAICDDGLECQAPATGTEGPGICVVKPPADGTEGGKCRQTDPANPLPACGEGLKCQEPLAGTEGPGICQSDSPANSPVDGAEGGKCRPTDPANPAAVACDEGLKCQEPLAGTEGPGICQSDSPANSPADGEEGGKCRPTDDQANPAAACNDDLECQAPVAGTEGPGICHAKPPVDGAEGGKCRPTDPANPAAVACDEGLKCQEPLAGTEGPGICQSDSPADSPADGEEGGKCRQPAQLNPGAAPDTTTSCNFGLECKEPLAGTDGPGICQPTPGTKGAQCNVQADLPISTSPGLPNPDNQPVDQIQPEPLQLCNDGLQCTPIVGMSDGLGTCEPLPGTEGAKCPIDTRGEPTLQECNAPLECQPDPKCADCPGECWGTVTILPIPTQTATVTRRSRRQETQYKQKGAEGDECVFSSESGDLPQLDPQTYLECSEGLQCFNDSEESPPFIPDGPIFGVCKGAICGGDIGEDVCDMTNGWYCEIDQTCEDNGYGNCQGQCASPQY